MCDQNLEHVKYLSMLNRLRNFSVQFTPLNNVSCSNEYSRALSTLIYSKLLKSCASEMLIWASNVKTGGGPGFNSIFPH